MHVKHFQYPTKPHIMNITENGYKGITEKAPGSIMGICPQVNHISSTSVDCQFAPDGVPSQFGLALILPCRIQL